MKGVEHMDGFAMRFRLRGYPAKTTEGRASSHAAALQVARFGTANEHGDWETAHHVFIYYNAVHQVLKRIDVADFVEASRAVLHGALAIYLTRYLNVPPARLPALGDDRLESSPSKMALSN
jgi:hypothetical protein